MIYVDKLDFIYIVERENRFSTEIKELQNRSISVGFQVGLVLLKNHLMATITDKVLDDPPTQIPQFFRLTVFRGRLIDPHL
jgi:hypothetical protein